jgi:hypothetical protein
VARGRAIASARWGCGGRDKAAVVTAAWVAGVAAAASLLGSMSADRPTLVLAACAGLIMLAVSTKPRLAIAVWLFVVTAVPYWLGLDVVVYLPPASLVGIALLVSSFKSRSRGSAADAFVGVILALATLILLLGEGSYGSWVQLLTQGALGYVIGRTIASVAGVRWTADVFAWLMVAAAAFAVVEYVFDVHPFVNLSGPREEITHVWARLQFRAGVTRSEAAFGHPIALGAALAVAAPLLLTVERGRRWRILALLVLVAGLATTLSRGPMLALGLTLLLAAYSMLRTLTPQMRAGLLALLALGGVAMVRLFTGVETSGGEETASSTQYRLDLFEQLTQDLHPFGQADGLVEGATGTIDYRSFLSIDNAFLYVAILYGWVLAALMLAALLVPLVRALQRRANPAEVALAGQLPALFTVALITQYYTLMWFLAGLAVTWVLQGEESGGVRGAALRGAVRGSEGAGLPERASGDPVVSAK